MSTSDLFCYLGLAVIGIALLYYGAEFLVRGGVSLALKARISRLVIGLTLAAFATSAPELVVSIDSALNGSADISLGNVIGSNICNIALILGLCAILRPIPFHANLKRFDLPVMLFAAFTLTVFYCLSRGINRWEGAFFFLCIVVYTVLNVFLSKKQATRQTKVKTNEAEAEFEAEDNNGKPLGVSLALSRSQEELPCLFLGQKRS